MYKFERLIVWQKSLILIESIYAVCKIVPNVERNNIIDQIKRAGLSISLNIAEGSGSQNDIEFKRFLYISRKSLFEVIAILKVINFLYKININRQLAITDEVGKLLNGLLKKLKANS